MKFEAETHTLLTTLPESLGGESVLSELPSMSAVSFQLPAGIQGSVARGCKDHNFPNRAASLNWGVWSRPGKLKKKAGFC